MVTSKQFMFLAAACLAKAGAFLCPAQEGELFSEATAAFEVRGVLTLKGFDTKGTMLQNDAYPFLVAVSNSAWYIKVDFGEDHYHAYGSDGTNTYSFLSAKLGGEDVPVLPGDIVDGVYPSTASIQVKSLSEKGTVITLEFRQLLMDLI